MTEVRMRLFLVSLLVLLSTVAAAQPSSIVVYPPSPTSDTPITVGIITSCPRNDTYRVEKRANEVLLIIKASGTCPSPPIDNLDAFVEIGTLPAGTYRVAYIFEGGDDIIRQIGTIHVRHAKSPTVFDIHPFTVRTNPANLRLRISPINFGHFCPLGDCSGTTIRVGGVLATDLRGEDDGSVTFLAPPHAKGLVDVVVERGGNTYSYPNALYYVDSPDLFAFERILFPVLFDAPGANGSMWRSEAVVSNPNPWWSENWNAIDSVVCITFPCGERLAPYSYARITGGLYPRGIALLVPRPEADALDFALRVRDVSREAEGYGTEVPVVRERDLLIDRSIDLLDVPLDPRYRVKLRMYAFDPVLVDNRVTVRITSPETNEMLSVQQVILTRDCQGCVHVPFYGELDLSARPGGGRYLVQIIGPEGAPSWAFATVTNNNSQQVTVVTPQ